MHKAVLVVGIASISFAAAVFLDSTSSQPEKKKGGRKVIAPKPMETTVKPRETTTKQDDETKDPKAKDPKAKDSKRQPTPLEDYRKQLAEEKERENQRIIKEYNDKHAYRGGDSRGERHLYLNRRAYEKARQKAPVVSLDNRVTKKGKRMKKKRKSRKTKKRKEKVEESSYPINKEPKNVDIREEEWEAEEPLYSNSQFSD